MSGFANVWFSWIFIKKKLTTRALHIACAKIVFKKQRC
jgi:hypothetical protein